MIPEPSWRTALNPDWSLLAEDLSFIIGQCYARYKYHITNSHTHTTPPPKKQTNKNTQSSNGNTFSFFCIRVMRISQGLVFQRWRWCRNSLIEKKGSSLAKLWFRRLSHRIADTSIRTDIYLHLLPEPGDHRPLLAWEENFLLPHDPWHQL